MSVRQPRSPCSSCAITSRGLQKYCWGEYDKKFETRDVYTHA
jgi:hypothetical protein